MRDTDEATSGAIHRTLAAHLAPEYRLQAGGGAVPTRSTGLGAQ